MKRLIFKGAVSGILSNKKTGVDRRPIEELDKYLNEIDKLINEGKVLKGTFFNSNNTDIPDKIIKRKQTHTVIKVFRDGKELNVVIDITDTPYGKIARGYANMMGLEPVLRVEEDKPPSFDIVLIMEKDGFRYTTEYVPD